MEFKNATFRINSSCGCNLGDKGDYDNTANIMGSSISMDNIETEGTGTVGSIL